MSEQFSKPRILFCGYKWNFKRTGSSNFFVEYLKLQSSVDFFLDPIFDNKKIDEINAKKYSAIIFFQMDPRDIHKRLSCRNLIFVPMYDACSDLNVGFVFPLRNIKVVAFCKRIHDVCRSYRIPSYYVKYYPEPDFDVISNEKDNHLLWQRREYCSWKNLKQYIGNENDLPAGVSQIFLHSATDDGGDSFVRPTEEDMEKYNITVTSWFSDINEYFSILNRTALFVAPREKEGIGMSFLDAMAKGAVIVAHNDATMDEYVDDSNGYIVDFFDEATPRIDFSDWKKKKEVSVQRLIDGRKSYIDSLDGLSDFIFGGPLKFRINVLLYYSYFIHRARIFVNSLKPR